MTSRARFCHTALVALGGATVAPALSIAQNAAPTPVPVRDSARRDGGRAPQIQDNSFLVEEAYNQSPGVVQNISVLQYYRRSGTWIGQFTQEWPVGGLSNQLSYTLSVVRPASGIPVGVGDALIHYRYQLVGGPDAPLAIAPRLSLILPTGSYRMSRGLGAPGVTAAIPASIALAERWVLHVNAGLAVIPRARNALGDRARVSTWSAAGSVVWLTRPSLNFQLEYRYDNFASVIGPGEAARGSQTTVSPGVRWAYNFPSGLQIVPGVAVPISLADGRRERSVLLYLSFEGPFTRAARERAATK